jgi:hypothetical protein
VVLAMMVVTTSRIFITHTNLFGRKICELLRRCIWSCTIKL